jgi:hypothetical protein
MESSDPQTIFERPVGLFIIGQIPRVASSDHAPLLESSPEDTGASNSLLSKFIRLL